MTREDLYESLVVERYAPSPWWTRQPEPTTSRRPDFDDSEATCARRRRQLAADFDATTQGAA